MAADTEQLREQLEQMQMQLAFQEDTIHALNQAVSQHQRELLVLRRQLELLKQRQDEAAAVQEEGAGPGAQERPPHY